MARYPRRRRNMLLHTSIVALAAATTSLWLAKPQTTTLERLSPNLDWFADAKSQFRVPQLHLRRPAGKPATVDWLVLNEDPPSVAIVAPDVISPAPAVVTDPAASTPPDAGAPADASPADSSETAPVETEAVPPPAPTPTTVRATAVTTAYLRSGPTTDALITGTLPAGTATTVVACSAGCSWLLVQTPGGSQAWSASSWYSISGGTAGLPAR